MVPAQKSLSGIQFSRNWVPVLDTRKLKSQKVGNKLKSAVSKNLQGILYGVQDSSTSIVTVNTVGVWTTTVDRCQDLVL